LRFFNTGAAMIEKTFDDGFAEDRGHAEDVAGHSFSFFKGRFGLGAVEFGGCEPC
jgi:hypothetical protein